MNAHYPLVYEPATAEYVLDVFRYQYRSWFSEDGADCDIPTRSHSWDDLAMVAYDDMATRWEQRETICHFFDAEIPVREWDALYGWIRYPKIGAVCDLIAKYAERPVIRPWKYLDGRCRPAGAFLTVRSMLIDLGEEPNDITPRSRVEPHFRRHYMEFGTYLVRIAPNSLPIYNSDFPTDLPCPFSSYPLMPRRVDFGNIRTFRDLAYALSKT